MAFTVSFTTTSGGEWLSVTPTNGMTCQQNVTADGKRAVSGSEDHTLRVWDLEGNQPPRVLEGHTAEVRAVALTPDGTRAVSGSDDHRVRVWDLESNQPLRVLVGHTAKVRAVALTANGKRGLRLRRPHGPGLGSGGTPTAARTGRPHSRGQGDGPDGPWQARSLRL